MHLRSVASVLPLCLFASAALAGTISLEWNAVAGATGYRLYHGTRSGQYDTVVDVGNVTAYALGNLPDCVEHFVAIKARNASGESVSFSNEISGWPKPRITAHEPQAAPQGSQFVLTIRGANFDAGAELYVNPDKLPHDAGGRPLVTFSSPQVVSCREMQVLVTLETAARGLRAAPVGGLLVPFRVTNVDRVYGWNQRSLTIDFAVGRADVNRGDATTRDRVDGKDLTWLAWSHGSDEGAPTYNPDADLDGSGAVDGDDLALLAPRFGLCWAGADWSPEPCP